MPPRPVLPVVSIENLLSDVASTGENGRLKLAVDLDDLPDYAGPPEPVGGPPPEWGAAAADTPEPELGDPG